MNSKAEQSTLDVAGKSIFYLIAGVIISLVIVGLMFFILPAIKSKLTEVPPQLQSEFIALRFTHNPACFAVTDKNTGTVRTNTVDVARFTTEILNQCYRTEEEKGFKTFNFRLKLTGSGKEIYTNNYFYEDKDDLTLEQDILTYDGNSYAQDQLIIYVQEKI